MEITLEKIELVKDRTGVNYKEAKDALIKADGSVVDAIIMIEDEIDITPKSKAGNQASQLVERVKELVKKGNVSKIVVKKDGNVYLNIPVNVGIVGAVWVFWPTVVAAVIALGTKCSIELVKDNGDVINISDKASETFGGVKENCAVIADDIKEMGGDALSQVKGKASNVINKAQNAVEDLEAEIEEKFESIEEEIEEIMDTDDTETAPAEEVYEKTIEIIDPLSDNNIVGNKAEVPAYDDYDDDYFNFDDFDESVLEDTKSEPEVSINAVNADDEIQSDAEKMAEKAAEEFSKDFDKAEEKFEESIEEYKKSKSRFKFF